MDEANEVEQARLHIVEFRGFERFILGRPYWEVPVIVQRLCGICPVSHHLAAAKAMDRIVGGEHLTPDRREDPPADALRADLPEPRAALLPPGQPRPAVRHGRDRSSAFGAPVEQRNVIAVAAKYPELAVQGVLMRRLRPGDHPGDRRQEDPRHRRDSRGRQQEPLDRRAGRAAARSRPDAGLGPRRGEDRPRLHPRAPRRAAALRIVRFEPPVPGASDGRGARPLRRRAARGGPEGPDRSSTASTTSATSRWSARKSGPGPT